MNTKMEYEDLLMRNEQLMAELEATKNALYKMEERAVWWEHAANLYKNQLEEMGDPVGSPVEGAD